MRSTVIDCDVHHARRTDAELLDFLPRAWREYAGGLGFGGTIPLTVSDGYPNPHGFMRADSYGTDGAPAGSDLQLIDEQLLTPASVTRAVLTYGDDIHVSGHHNPYFATALAQALNDWTIERWLDADDRLVGSILVAAQMPDKAADEIPWVRRLPSDYFREHVWVSTQPLELPPHREQLYEALEWIGGGERLVFSSDYPHWDSDEFQHVRSRLPEDWHDNIFRRNAMRLYDWSDADVPAGLAASASE